MQRPGTRRDFIKQAGAGASLLGMGGLLAACGGGGSTSTSTSAATNAATAAKGPIDVGLLNSLSGNLSIVEVPLHNVSLMAIDEINAAGGVNGRQLKAISQDYASDFTQAVQKSDTLINKYDVAITIGGYTSASRVAVIPTFRDNDAIFFYGTYFEGLECDPNVFYSGAVPNQFLIDYVPWILSNLGKTFYIVGSDYVYPRTVSAIVRKLVAQGGGKVVADRYFPLGTTDFGAVISDIGTVKPDVVFSNLVADSVPAFYKQYRSAGFTAAKNPIAATVTTEDEVAAMGAENGAGHYMSATYFQSLPNDNNKKFVEAYQSKYGADAVTFMPLVGTYNAVWLFAKAAAKAPDLSPASLSKALIGATFDENPEGAPITIASDHFCNHPSYIGQANKQGQYDIVKSFESRPADPFPPQVVPAGKRPECPVPTVGK